jgi:serine/threonine-protein kinase
MAQQPSLGIYTIMGELGRGGMGRVYKALHRTLRQVRALKVLSKRESSDPHVLARFQREARIVAALDHPHIVKIFEFEKDSQKGYYYFVMEFVDGGSVARILRRKGKLPWQQATEITLQVALGLVEMHRHNLVHRDIKPSNILIDKVGTAKLADLGLARYEGDGSAETQLTATGAVMGTIDYMAPEQIVDARHADIRSDLYALGCTLFHMITGQVPFPDGSAYQKIENHLHRSLPEVGPRAPDVPFQLVLILNRLTEKDPRARYQTPQELIVDLEALIGQTGPESDDFEASAITQLQALAEVAAKDRSVSVSSGSSPGSIQNFFERIGVRPQWIQVGTSVGIGLLLLVFFWLIIAAMAAG